MHVQDSLDDVPEDRARGQLDDLDPRELMRARRADVED